MSQSRFGKLFLQRQLYQLNYEIADITIKEASETGDTEVLEKAHNDKARLQRHLDNSYVPKVSVKKY